MHELEHALIQLSKTNSGFVDDFARAYPLSQTADRADIMKYFADGTLPALHALAKNFCGLSEGFSNKANTTPGSACHRQGRIRPPAARMQFKSGMPGLAAGFETENSA